MKTLHHVSRAPSIPAVMHAIFQECTYGGMQIRHLVTKTDKTWYVNHNGKQINLGKDKAAAEKMFHQLMASDELPVQDSIPAAELMDRFLLWCKDNRAPRTFDWYKAHLQTLLDRLAP